LAISDFDPPAAVCGTPAIALRSGELVHAAKNEKRREKPD
jgi:hypothetical protein